VPAERLHAIETHIGGLIHHGGDKLIGLVVLEEDEEDGGHMSNVSVEELLPLLLPEEEQQFLEDHTAPLIQEGRDDCFPDGGGLSSEEGDGFIEVDLILEAVIVGLEVVEVLVEDDADDDLVVLDGHSAAWGWIYRLMAYFQRVDTTSSSFLLYPYSTVLMSMDAFHLASSAACSSS
jgi:hypothetical protein